MQTNHRVHPVTVAAVLVGCALLSAVTLAAIAGGIAAAVGTGHTVVIAEVVAASVFVVNALALSMAVSRGEADANVAGAPVADPLTESVLQARAS